VDEVLEGTVTGIKKEEAAGLSELRGLQLNEPICTIEDDRREGGGRQGV